MKILFIYPEMGIQINNPLGISYLSAVLKGNNHHVSLIRAHKERASKKLIKAVKRLKPDIIAFSFVSNFAHIVEKLSLEIKEACNVPIIAGGIHTTVEPLEVLNYKGIDFICVGEGEEAFLELVTKLEKKEDTSFVRNIWLKKEGIIIKNELRDLADLDSLPMPDVDIFYRNPKSVKKLSLMTQRGCPYNCPYCCNEYLNKLYAGKGKRIRKMSLGKVMSEIEVFIKRYLNLRWIDFADDTFIIDKKRVEEFCSLYQSKFNMPFSISSRPELIDLDIARSLKKAGCVRICIGIESGDESFRKEYLCRKISNNCIVRAFDILKKVGIPSRGYLIYGFPLESEENMRNSFNLFKKINPSDGSQISVFYPYPKTSSHELCKKLNLLTKTKKITYFGNKTTLNFDKQKKKLIKRYYELSEDFHHNSNDGIVFFKNFYPLLLIPYILLRTIIPPKLIWRFMYKTKMQYFKKVFTLKVGW